MSTLELTPNIQDPDTIYQMLVNMHLDLEAEDSMKVSAKLILILANQIGDTETIADAIILASRHNRK